MDFIEARNDELISNSCEEKNYKIFSTTENITFYTFFRQVYAEENCLVFCL